MDDFLEKKPKKHNDAAMATAARFSWVMRNPHSMPGYFHGDTPEYEKYLREFSSM